jgi:hypothetical protein
MRVHNVKQGTAEWNALRLGVPTASEFDQIITPEWKIRTGQMPETYLYRKLCEHLLGYSPKQDFCGYEMDQGAILEGEARPYYAFTYDVQIQTPGFCTTDDGRIGCSPDGLIGEDGGLEIKCPQPERALKYLLRGEVPPEYLAQVHGSMLVTGRPWWVFMSYSRQFPPFVVRVERDPKIDATLRQALGAWLEKFDAQLARICAMRDEQNAVKQAEWEKTGDHTR